MATNQRISMLDALASAIAASAIAPKEKETRAAPESKRMRFAALCGPLSRSDHRFTVPNVNDVVAEAFRVANGGKRNATKDAQAAAMLAEVTAGTVRPKMDSTVTVRVGNARVPAAEALRIALEALTAK